MDWTQLFSLGASLAGYTTAVCYFFYSLNEKTIKEWRQEHAQQINTFNQQVTEWRREHTEQMKENEAHWREMFMYMSKRIDAVQGVSDHKASLSDSC